jgi:serine/threonine protein kinase
VSEPIVPRPAKPGAPSGQGAERPTEPEGAGSSTSSLPPNDSEPAVAGPSISPRAALGTLIAGRYRLVRILGRGGMSTVFEAERVELGKRVAIKVLLPTLAASNEAKGRFLREARAVAQIDSENIVQVFDVGEDAAYGLYMVMELLKGETAAARIERQGRMAIPDAAALAYHVCNALEKAHAAGIVHRDLNVANVFLQRIDANTTRIRVLDFGIAKLLDKERAANGETLSRNGMMVGTPQYMAPEQIEGQEVDHRADLYGLGALLYECIVGKPAYGTDVPYQRMLLDILTKPPPRLSDAVAGVPGAIDELVYSLMARQPSQRPQSAAAVQETLLAIFPELPDHRPRFRPVKASDEPVLGPSEPSHAPLASASNEPAKPITTAPPSRLGPSRHGARSTSSRALLVAAILSAAALLLVGAWSLSRVRAPVAAAVSSPRSALIQRGRIAIAEGQPALAVELARGAIDEDATNAESWLLLGAAYEALKNPDAAQGAYRDCVARAKGFRVNECAELAH